MKKFVVFSILLFSHFSLAETPSDVVNFIKNVVPAGKKYLVLDGIENTHGTECKLEVSYTDAIQGQFSVGAKAMVTLWIEKDGSPWPVKFDVEENSALSELQYAVIAINTMNAQNVVIPDDEYSDKERQTMILINDESKIQVSINNEQKRWFGYKSKSRANCSFERL